MNVILLDEKHLEKFITYCKKYKNDHDESFLYDEELDEFQVGNQDPTYLLIENDKIIGCLSYMVDPYYLADDKTRIRIFHCEETKYEHYAMLLDAAMPISTGIKRIEMFVPDALSQMKDVLKRLNFEYYRTSYVMIRKNQEALGASFPSGYRLQPLRKGQDELVYADIRNRAFKNLKGSEVPITKEMVIKHYTSNDLLKDGMQILWHEEQAVGVIRVIKEEDELGDFSCIAPIAIVPEYQHKGLGVTLLKAGIEIGQNNQLKDCLLVVNAENQKALSLYLKVGFEIDMAVSCYVRHLKEDEQQR